MFNKWLYPIAFVVGACLLSAGAQAQRKTVAELTLVYDYSAGPADKDKPEGTAGAAGTSGSANTASAVHTIYIKGNMSRSFTILMAIP